MRERWGLYFFYCCVCMPCGVSEAHERVARSDGIREIGSRKVDLSQRRVAHTETCANVFRYQFDSRAIADWVGLRQVLHGFHQQPLSIHISRIGGSFPALVTQLRRYGNRKNLSHEYILTDVWSV